MANVPAQIGRMPIAFAANLWYNSVPLTNSVQEEPFMRNSNDTHTLAREMAAFCKERTKKILRPRRSPTAEAVLSVVITTLLLSSPRSVWGQ